MPALLQMMRARGYEFVTLDRALADDAYRLPDHYAGPGGFSWVHRWSMTKRMKPKGKLTSPPSSRMRIENCTRGSAVFPVR